MNKKWIYSALNCGAYSFEGVSSDHRIVAAKIRQSLRRNTIQTTKTTQDDRFLLNNKDISNKYTIMQHNNVHSCMSTHIYIYIYICVCVCVCGCMCVGLCVCCEWPSCCILTFDWAGSSSSVNNVIAESTCANKLKHVTWVTTGMRGPQQIRGVLQRSVFNLESWV